jgi:hypothetical protein
LADTHDFSQLAFHQPFSGLEFCGYDGISNRLGSSLRSRRYFDSANQSGFTMIAHNVSSKYFPLRWKRT